MGPATHGSVPPGACWCRGAGVRSCIGGGGRRCAPSGGAGPPRKSGRPAASVLSPSLPPALQSPAQQHPHIITYSFSTIGLSSKAKFCSSWFTYNINCNKYLGWTCVDKILQRYLDKYNISKTHNIRVLSYNNNIILILNNSGLPLE